MGPRSCEEPRGPAAAPDPGADRVWRRMPRGMRPGGEGSMLDEKGHDWRRPPFLHRLVGDYLDVCANCGIERVGPVTQAECPGRPKTADETIR